MKDEIKEILNKMEDISYKYTTNWLELHYKDVKMLYDYITNLQKKVDQYENPDDLTLITMYCDLKAKDKIKQLQQENEEYKDIANMRILDQKIINIEPFRICLFQEKMFKDRK